jgi:integrase
MGIRKRGNAWQIVIDVGTKEQRQQKVFTFRGTKPEARAEEARLKAMYKMGTSLPGKMTVSEYMLYWLNTYKKRKLAVRTYESYKETIEVHIAEDDLGKKLFDRVTPDDIQKYYNRKLDKGLSGTSVLYHHRILHAAYNQAVKSRWLPWGMNPCAAVEPPEKNDYKPAELSTEQMAYIITNTSFHEYTEKGKRKRVPALKLPIIISSMIGARAGEVCGLQWPDIDYKRMAVHIRHAIKREDGQLVLGPTKNKEERWVPLTPGLKTILDWHKKEQEKDKEFYKTMYNNQGYVLAWEDGRCFDPHYLSEYFTKAMVDIGFKQKATFHSCRHFYASAMQSAGANLKYISDALGHGKMDNITADVYIHTQLEDMRKYVTWLDEAILKGVLEDIEGHIEGHTPL